MDPINAQQGNRSWLTPAIWTILGLAIVALGFYYILREDLVETPKKQLEAIASGNETDAYNKYTSEDFQLATSMNAFKTFLDLHPIFRKNPTVDLKVVDNKGDSRVLKGILSSSNNDSLAVEYKLVKEHSDWKIETITLLELGPRSNSVDADSLSELNKPIDAQLNALKQNDIHKAYYNLVSDEFQHSTSFKDFQAFVKENPILTSFTKIENVNHGVDGNEGKVTLKLYQGVISIPVEYKLKRVKGDWKVWSLRVIVTPNTDLSKSPASTQELSLLFENSIAPIRENNIPKAYYQNTTQNYRSENSIDSFRKFVEANPSLKNATADYYQGYIADGLAIMKVHLKGDDDQALLRISMRKEGDDWKLDNIESLTLSKPLWASKARSESKELIAQLAPNEIARKPIVASDPQLATDTNNAIFSVEQLLKALRSGDFNTAYNKYTAGGFKQTNSFGVFQNFVNTYPILTTVTPQLNVLDLKNGFASISAQLSAHNNVTVVNFLVIKEADQWKVLAIDVNQPKILSMPASEQAAPKVAEPAPTPAQPAPAPKKDIDPQDILPPVEQLLTSIRHSDYSAAYKYYMSKGFQKATTYEQFRKVMQRLPALSQNDPIFTKPVIQGDSGEVTAKFNGPYGSAVLDFSLIQEDNNWKIHILNVSGSTSPTSVSSGAPVTERPNPLPPEHLDPSLPEYPIQMQIYFVSSGDINRSYFELTSHSFQRSTNLQEYHDFINGYPPFTNNADYKIANQQISSDTASYIVTLTSKQGEKGIFDYDLIKEDNVWRILNIQIEDYTAPPKGISDHGDGSPHDKKASQAPIHLAPIHDVPPNHISSGKEEGQNSLSFNYGAFGTSVNGEGLIEKPLLSIPKGKSNIYFNLYVENGKKGQMISLTFKHLNSGTTIPEIHSTVKSDGTSTMSFIFASPASGWPEGVYEVKVIADSGFTKTFSFRVQ